MITWTDRWHKTYRNCHSLARICTLKWPSRISRPHASEASCALIVSDSILSPSACRHASPRSEDCPLSIAMPRRRCPLSDCRLLPERSVYKVSCHPDGSLLKTDVFCMYGVEVCRIGLGAIVELRRSATVQKVRRRPLDDAAPAAPAVARRGPGCTFQQAQPAVHPRRCVYWSCLALARA
jgi:hypothetical protein